MKTKDELRLYFENGDKPTQQHFWDWQDSYWHKDEKIPQESLDIVAIERFMYSPTDHTELLGTAKTLIVPEGTKAIGLNSFSFTGIAKNYITKVIFPDTLEIIKSGAFSLQHITGSLKIPGSCKIVEARAFSSYSIDLMELILEEGVETIGDQAFQLSGSKSLFDLYIPNSARSVGQNAFAIPSLITVSAPSGLDLGIAGIPTTATITYR